MVKNNAGAMKRIILVTAAILTPLWLTTPVKAQIIFRPPNLQPPNDSPEGRGQGEGLRSSLVQQGKPLTALIPKTQLGLTVAEYPIFFIYVPQASGQTGVFTLVNEEDKIIYETRLKLPSQAGVVSFNLPNTGTLAPLKIGKPYRWYFSIVYDFDDRSKNSLVKGWIQRVEPSPDLLKKLEQVAPKNRPALYAAAGIWHETLATLAELRRSTPDDVTLVQQWEELLKSQTVELEVIAKEPLRESLSTPGKTSVPPLDTGKVPNGSGGGGRGSFVAPPDNQPPDESRSGGATR